MSSPPFDPNQPNNPQGLGGNWPPQQQPGQGGFPPQPNPGGFAPPPPGGYSPQQPGGSWPQGQGGYPQGGNLSSANGTTILVMGILAFFCFGIILGPIAWVMGNSALKAIDSGLANPSERGTVSAGRICGIIATFLNIFYIIIYVCYIVFFAAAMHAGTSNFTTPSPSAP